MKRHHKYVIGSGAVLIFVLSQLALVYLIYDLSGQSIAAIESTKQDLNDKIDINRVELQAEISMLENEVNSVSSQQSDIKAELSEVKATTSSDFSGVFEDSIGGVVSVLTDVSQGTGFIVSEDGYLITNYHVMEDASAAAIKTSDGESHAVVMIGFNEELDVALLKIEGNFDALDLGDSGDVKIGEKVIAIGNPLGLEFTLTEGVVSAKEREGINGLPYYIQIDAALNPGNSGGPLLDTSGDVIGINNFKVSGAESVGFALEINQAKIAVNNIAREAINQTIV